MSKVPVIALPYGAFNGSARVTQGYGGDTSHTGNLYYSIDFAGSGGLAGRNALSIGEGKVIDAGPKASDPSHIGNFVTAYFSELGIYASYLHLEDVFVSKDDAIQFGQALGTVGGTGTDSPHLHFHVGARTIHFKSGVVANASAGSNHSGGPVDFSVAASTSGELAVGTSYSSDNYGAAGVTLRGTTGDNLVVGTASADNLYGGAGADLLLGKSGNDSLRGEDGNDTVYGGGGDDLLFGGSGNDRLTGDAGPDTLDGGSGNDVFDYNGLSDSPDYARSDDLAFQSAGAKTGDRIDLSGIDADSGRVGNQAFKFLKTKVPVAGSGMGKAWTSDYVETGVGNITLLNVSVDADRDPEMVIRISDGAATAASWVAGDFIL